MAWQAKNLDLRKHCFFGAEGGVSRGIYAGLNVNTKSKDNPDDLAENLRRIATRFGVETKDLLLLNQGVSARAVFVEEASQDQIEADGAVSDQLGVVLCIRTADCAPVLLEDRVAGIVGAAHAGWRGAYKGIIENVVGLMLDKGAELKNIAAAVGPCIGQSSYEVDMRFYRQFVDENKAFERYFAVGKKEGFYQFDLEEFCVDKLKGCGLTNIEVSGQDTYALKDKYYSFRRFTHQGIIKEPKCFATEMSAIVL